MRGGVRKTRVPGTPMCGNYHIYIYIYTSTSLSCIPMEEFHTTGQEVLTFKLVPSSDSKPPPIQYSTCPLYFDVCIYHDRNVYDKGKRAG